MLKKKPKRYYNELYRQQYEFYVGWSRKAFTEAFKKKYGIDPEVEEYMGVCIELWSLGRSVIIVWSQNNSGMSRTRTVMHECIHAAIKTLDARGIFTTAKNQEPLAYLTEYLFAKAMR